MKNILDYTETYFETMDESQFNPVDSLVLSQLAYVFYDDIFAAGGQGMNIEYIKTAQAEHYPSMFRIARDEDNNKRLLYAVAANPRFRGMRLSNYVNIIDDDSEKQFSAMVFKLPDGKWYIAFRGTDATLIGWKEDFNMSFKTPVAAQVESVSYINEIARRLKGDLIFGGHSKGGNLAAYAAMNCKKKIQDRIVNIYDHDGPGFRKEIIESNIYSGIEDRIYKTMPQSAVVGMLLENLGSCSIVESRSLGIMQHDPYSWSVDETDFIYTDKTTKSSQYLDTTVSQWLAEVSDDKRELFVDTMFSIISAGGAKTLAQFTSSWMNAAQKSLGEFRSIDPEVRKFLLQTFRRLITISMKNLKPVSRKKPTAKKLIENP